MLLLVYIMISISWAYAESDALVDQDNECASFGSSISFTVRESVTTEFEGFREEAVKCSLIFENGDRLKLFKEDIHSPLQSFSAFITLARQRTSLCALPISTKVARLQMEFQTNQTLLTTHFVDIPYDNEDDISFLKQTFEDTMRKTGDNQMARISLLTIFIILFFELLVIFGCLTHRERSTTALPPTTMVKTTVSQLSMLSASTASVIDEPRRELNVVLSVDDLKLYSILSEGGIDFPHKQFTFHVKQEIVQGELVMKLSVTSLPDSEWSLLYQTRVKTGQTMSTLSVVDKEVIDFHPRSRPFSILIRDNDITTLKFELRTMNQLSLALPTFADGDVGVRFSDGTEIRTHRGLLAIASQYMDNCVSRDGTEFLDVGTFPIKDFKELLYQLYPTRRPLWAQFRSLARAAVAFKADDVIYRLSTHVINFNDKPLTMEDRLRAALDQELELAVKELVFRAAQDGTWSSMIRHGFEPESFFPKQVYKEIVCPAIILARNRGFMDSMFRSPYCTPQLLLEGADPYAVCVLFLNTPFYVNSGIMAVHGTDGFARSDKGELLAMFSHDMLTECAAAEVIPGEMLMSLLCWLYPGGPSVPHQLLRPAIVFCHEHKWTIAKENLEQLLLLEPAVTADEYLGQLVFAEKFSLENMLLNCVHRAEASCHHLANELVLTSRLSCLSQRLREKILERMCGGWGVDPPHVNRLGIRNATAFRERMINYGGVGGAAQMEDGSRADGDGTLASLHSDFYFGSVKELVLVD